MKTILTRINLDIKHGEPEDTLRFHVAVDIIKSLSTDRNKLVILSHNGRPERYEKILSLRELIAPLSKEVGKDIQFIGELDINVIRGRIQNSKKGGIFMLENLRFHPGEKNNNPEFAKALASLGDIYLGNDFATSHHEAASLVGITDYIKSKPGELLKKEIKNLDKAKHKVKSPSVIIIGGAKVKDKVSAIEYLLPRADCILLGGVVGNTFSRARGFDVKDSIFDNNVALEIKSLAKNTKIFTPFDHRAENRSFLDIGEQTEQKYAEIISTAKTIVWAGPMGYFENPEFAKGSIAVGKAVLANKKAHTVIGGAQTVSSLPIEPIKQQNDNIFLSTGGGAMLAYLADKKLPALVALKLQK